MCFDIHPEHKKALVAEEDIRCWKTVLKSRTSEDKWTSIYRHFTYVKGRIYDGLMCVGDYAGIFGDGSPIQYVTAGFHSYTDKALQELTDTYRWRRGDGTLLEMCIPKGTRYYHNPLANEYVSDSIMCVGEYKFDQVCVST